MPPFTPRQLRGELGKQPNLRKRLARGWILLGALVAAFAGVMAIAHYLYGVPVHYRATGQPMAPALLLAIVLFMGGGGVLAVVERPP